MDYLLNSLNDIQSVYSPDIECLVDDFVPYLSEFKLSKKTILEAMRFRFKFVTNKEQIGFSSDLSLEAILTGIQLNLISKDANRFEYNFDYKYLLKNIDLEVFQVELDRKVSVDENKFIEIIDSNLEKMNTILFEKNLKKDVSSLLNSISILESLLISSNDFDKIVIKKYLSSYNKIYSSLEIEYKPSINNKEIFKSTNQFDLDKLHDFNSWEVIKAFSPNPPKMDNFSNIYIKHLSDKLEFDRFKKNKETIVSVSSPKESKVSDWKRVVELIFNGKILVNKISMGYEFYFDGIKFDNATALGNEVALFLNKKKDTIRPIITDSIYDSGGVKNIFVKKNVQYLKVMLENDASKICTFFKSKIEALVSSDN